MLFCSGHTQNITMSEDKTVTLKPVDLVEPESCFSSSHLDPTHTSYHPQALDSGHPGTEEKGPVGFTPDAEAQGNRWTSTLDQFKLKRFFVLRVGVYNDLNTGSIIEQTGKPICTQCRVVTCKSSLQ